MKSVNQIGKVVLTRLFKKSEEISFASTRFDLHNQITQQHVECSQFHIPKDENELGTYYTMWGMSFGLRSFGFGPDDVGKPIITTLAKYNDLALGSPPPSHIVVVRFQILGDEYERFEAKQKRMKMRKVIIYRLDENQQNDIIKRVSFILTPVLIV